jgi:hypothetical protein
MRGAYEYAQLILSGKEKLHNIPEWLQEKAKEHIEHHHADHPNKVVLPPLPNRKRIKSETEAMDAIQYGEPNKAIIAIMDIVKQKQDVTNLVSAALAKDNTELTVNLLNNPLIPVPESQITQLLKSQHPEISAAAMRSVTNLTQTKYIADNSRRLISTTIPGPMDTEKSQLLDALYIPAFTETQLLQIISHLNTKPTSRKILEIILDYQEISPKIKEAICGLPSYFSDMIKDIKEERMPGKDQDSIVNLAKSLDFIKELIVIRNMK